MPPTPRLRARRPAVRIAVAAVLAVLCHGVTLTVLALTGALERVRPSQLPTLVMGADARDAEPERPIEVSELVEEIEKPREETAAEKKQKEEEAKKDAPGQVVDIARPAVEQRPDEARFASEYDQSVNRETRGAVGKDKAGALSPSAAAQPKAPSAPIPSPLPPTPPGPVNKSNEPPKALAVRGPVGNKVPGPTGPATDVEHVTSDGEMAHSAGQGAVRAPDKPGGSALPGGGALPNLKPSSEALQQALGEGTGSPDYLDGLEETGTTMLNSKRWKFAAFFNRMKHAVAQEWKPDDVLGRHDPSGGIYGRGDRMTVLRVEIKPDGRVGELSVKKPSGVEFLDDEAMMAFKRAQPYDNPPPGLADADGIIRFNFAFVVQLSGRPATSYKVYRD